MAHASTDPQTLREGSRSLTASRRRMTLRNALVVGQVALTVVLLAGAGLLIRSGMRLRSVDPGFSPAGVTTLSLALSPAAYKDYASTASLYRRLAEQLEAAPGVRSVGYTEALPLAGDIGCTGVSTRGEGTVAGRDRCIPLLQVSPGYFATMGISVRGRSPDWGEVTQRLGGVVVSPALAHRLWPDQDPIGQPIRCCGNGGWDHVVGVTGEVHGNSLETPPGEIAYFSIAPPDSAPTNNVPLDIFLAINAPTVSPLTMQRLVTQALADIDPTVPASAARPMTELVAESMANRTFMLTLLAAAAAMALLLSAVGLYGVIAYVVGQREREIGVRIAVGASGRQIGSLVMGQSVRLVALGVAIGIAGALGGTRVLTSFLFEISPTDPAVIGGVAVLVVSLGVVASGVPTLRAIRTDPVTALRSE